MDGLQITSPAGFEHFIHELGRPPQRAGLPDPSQPDVARVVETSQRYGCEIVGPSLSADTGVADSSCLQTGH